MKKKNMILKIDDCGTRAELFACGQLAIEFVLRDQVGVFEPIAQTPEYEAMLLKDIHFHWKLESILLYLRGYREDYLKLATRKTVIENVCNQILGS